MSSKSNEPPSRPIGPNVQAFGDTFLELLDAFKGHGFQKDWEGGQLPVEWITYKTDGSKGLAFPVASCTEDCGHMWLAVNEDGVKYGVGHGQMLFKGHHPSHLAAFFFGLVVTNTPFHPPLCPCCEAKTKDENASTESAPPRYTA